MINVLVVDDDDDLAEMVTMVLNKAGMCVRSIGKGELFFDTVDHFKPDVILMDIYLGDRDGRDLCRTLKSGERSTQVPVILYSAGHITTASIRESGADAFIPKPFVNEQIIKQINELIN